MPALEYVATAAVVEDLRRACRWLRIKAGTPCEEDLSLDEKAVENLLTPHAIGAAWFLLKEREAGEGIYRQTLGTSG